MLCMTADRLTTWLVGCKVTWEFKLIKETLYLEQSEGYNASPYKLPTSKIATSLPINHGVINYKD